MTRAKLKKILSYDPHTGVFVWLISSGKARRGEIAGTLRPDGYMQIRYKGVNYYGHRLAWLYMTGRNVAQLDHENLNRSDNAFLNLRKSTNTQNRANCRKYKNNRSGCKGVYMSNGRWAVQVGRKHIGRFTNLADAATAYNLAAALEYGSFARSV